MPCPNPTPVKTDRLSFDCTVALVSNKYDFSSLKNQTQAARKTGIQIIWDIFHYGYPDDLDIFSAEFIERFTAFAASVAEFLAIETKGTLLVCPVNEISFFAWAAGESRRALQDPER